MPWRPTHPGKDSLRSLPSDPQPSGASGWRRLLPWVFGLLTLVALVLIVLHFGAIEQFTRLALAAQPRWFGVARDLARVLVFDLVVPPEAAIHVWVGEVLAPIGPIEAIPRVGVGRRRRPALDGADHVGQTDGALLRFEPGLVPVERAVHIAPPADRRAGRELERDQRHVVRELHDQHVAVQPPVLAIEALAICDRLLIGEEYGREPLGVLLAQRLQRAAHIGIV